MGVGGRDLILISEDLAKRNLHIELKQTCCEDLAVEMVTAVFAKLSLKFDQLLRC